MTDPPEEAGGLGIAGFEGAVEVGRGGFAVVYRATQPALNRQVAVKVLAPTDAANQRRFQREGWAMGALSGHPNIAEVFETGVTPAGRPYIVMPYLAQGSLADRVDTEGPLPWSEVARIGVKLAGALEAAHRSGTLHRDVKPANVLLSDYGEPILSDFGIAMVEGQATATESGITASVAHAAPELFDGRASSVAADLYALGSTLVTLLDGRPPFGRRPDEELVQQISRIAREPVRDLRPAGVPDALCRVLERAMAKNPSERPASALELGRQLQEAQRRSGLPVTDMALGLPGADEARPRPESRRRSSLSGDDGSGEVTEGPPEGGESGRQGASAARRPLSRIAAATALVISLALVAAAALALRTDSGGGDDVASGSSTTVAHATTTQPEGEDAATIAVGSGPTAVVSARIDDRALIFVASSGARSVSVIDASTNAVVATVALTSRPTGIAVNPRSKQLFVTNAEAVLTVVDATTFDEIGAIELPSRPSGITVNHRQNLLYVTSSEQSLWVVDGKEGKIISTVELDSAAMGVDINPQTNRLYVTGPDEGVLWVIDGESFAITATVPVGSSACGVALSPRSNRIYVTRPDGAELVVVSGESDQVVARVAVAAQSCGVTVNPEANRVYAASQSDGSVTVVDGQTDTAVGSLRFPAGPIGLPLLSDVGTDPDTRRVYVVSRATDAVAVLLDG